jgi:hypothetical protein
VGAGGGMNVPGLIVVRGFAITTGACGIAKGSTMFCFYYFLLYFYFYFFFFFDFFYFYLDLDDYDDVSELLSELEEDFLLSFFRFLDYLSLFYYLLFFLDFFFYSDLSLSLFFFFSPIYKSKTIYN